LRQEALAEEFSSAAPPSVKHCGGLRCKGDSTPAEPGRVARTQCA
jgi:hypothetical protein